MDNTPTTPVPTDNPEPSLPPPAAPQTDFTPQVIAPSQPIAPATIAPASFASVPPAAQTPTLPDVPGMTAPTAPVTAAAPLPDTSGLFQPSTPPAPQVGTTAVGSMMAVGSARKKSKKGLLIGAIAGIFLLGGTAAGYFGYIVPNKPENVWKTALVNMGDAYDEVVGYGLEMESAKGVAVDGTFAYAYDDNSLSGDYSVKSFESDMTSVINLKQSEFSAKFELMSVTPEGRTLPNLYIKVAELNRLDTLTDPASAAAYQEYVGQWYVFDAAAYEDALIEEEAPKEYTKEDYKEVADAVGGVLKEYVFTSDESKAVLKLSEVKGAETKYDQSTYHYRVRIDKTAAEQFEKALTEKVKATKIGSSLTDEEISEEYTGDISRDLDENETFSIWVNRKTKLMQTIRVENEDSADDYADIGQLYEGGDIIPLFAKAVTKQDDTTSETDVDVALNRTERTATLKALSTESDSGNSFQLDTTFRTNEEALGLTVPADAKSIWTLLYGDAYQDPATQTLGVNTEVDLTDPKSLTTLTEEFRELITRLSELPNSQQ